MAAEGTGLIPVLVSSWRKAECWKQQNHCVALVCVWLRAQQWVECFLWWVFIFLKPGVLQGSC